MTTKAPLHILFAEPDLASSRPLRVELRRRGSRVEFAGSATDVLRKAQEDPPDLLILDEELQSQGELDLLKVFRTSIPLMEIILLHSGEDRALGCGMGLLFSARKPVSRTALLEVIDSAFPGRLPENTAPLPETHTLLCVDDDRAFLDSLSRVLKRRGYQVFSQENAERALEVLPGIHPELAIVDLMMPGMDGLGLIRVIHERSEGRVPVVALTALDSDEAYYRALENGASFCLTKPCKPEDFLNVVDFIAGDLDEEERLLLRKRLEGRSPQEERPRHAL